MEPTFSSSDNPTGPASSDEATVSHLYEELGVIAEVLKTGVFDGAALIKRLQDELTRKEVGFCQKQDLLDERQNALDIRELDLGFRETALREREDVLNRKEIAIRTESTANESEPEGGPSDTLMTNMERLDTTASVIQTNKTQSASLPSVVNQALTADGPREASEDDEVKILQRPRQIPRLRIRPPTSPPTVWPLTDNRPIRDYVQVGREVHQGSNVTSTLAAQQLPSVPDQHVQAEDDRTTIVVDMTARRPAEPESTDEGRNGRRKGRRRRNGKH